MMLLKKLIVHQLLVLQQQKVILLQLLQQFVIPKLVKLLVPEMELKLIKNVGTQLRLEILIFP